MSEGTCTTNLINCVVYVMNEAKVRINIIVVVYLSK
jgi:hypothetical protein